MINRKPSPDRHRRTGTRRLFWTAVHVLGSALLLYLIFRSNDIRDIWEGVKSVHPGAFMAATAFALATTVLASWRWQQLLPGSAIQFRVFLHMTLFANLVSLSLPSQFAADAMKTVRLSAKTKEPYRLVASVLADKFLGLTAAFFMGAVVAALIILSNEDHTTLLIGFSFAGAFALCLTLVFLGHWFSRKKWPGSSNQLHRVKFIHKLYEAFHILQSAPSRLWQSFGAALVFHALNGLLLFILAQGIDFPASYAQVTLVYVLSSTAVLLPISIGGLGIREMTFAMTFGLYGLPQDKAISLALLVFGVRLVMALAAIGIELALPAISLFKKRSLETSSIP